jgi:Bifunctional DNA primase/polymerase, N-terminal
VDRAALKLHMDAVLAARLGYAKRKWWSFAAPFTARWIKGKNLKKGIKWACEETHGIRWGATLDPEVIHAECAGKLFYGRLPDGRMSNGISLRNHNVGILTGIDWSRIIDLETDTEEHGTGINGEASKEVWEAINGPWPETASFISPSGSIHRIYNHPGEGTFIKSFDGTSAFGKGVDCKADGGYMFLAPPSYRPPAPARDGKPAKAGGFYRWDHKGEYYPTADLTPAMRAVLIRKPEPIVEKPPTGNNPFLDFEQDSGGSRSWAEAALNNEAAAVANKKQPGRNTQLHKSACNLGEIVGGGALTEEEVIDALMAAATANGSVGEDGDKACRNTIASGLRKGKLQPRTAPPRAADTLEYIEPTAPAANFDDLEAARRYFRKEVKNWLDPILNVFTDFSDEVGALDRHWASAHRIDTGVGKTSITAEEIARSDKTVVYAVPTHNLAGRIARLFAAHGVVAQVWRGRNADDPENPGEEMCLNPDAVALAIEVQADVTTSCCKYKNFKCDFFESCGYQRQITRMKQDKPRVIVAAADMLFHESTAIGTPDRVVIDESFWPKQLRGVDDAERYDIMTFDRMRKRGHGKLADSLSQQAEIGGLQRKYSFGYYDLTNLIIEQYKLKLSNIGLYPGMSKQEVDELKKDEEKIAAAIYSRQMIRLLKELRRMHRDWDMEQPSGRLLIEDNEGTRGIRWRGVAKITKQFRQETLILDATLPDLAVLEITHPLVNIDSDIRVALPESVSIRQVLDSPTSSNKLIKSKAKMPERHLQSIRRYILRRWMETGKGPTTVICQQKVAWWLSERLPDKIELAHFNAIAGLDIYRDARLLIVVGRTQPGPKGVETLAATLSGEMPAQMATPVNGFAWFDQVQRGIRLRDGTGVAVQGDRHPDDFCEAIRWQTCEAELVQAIGRARAIWRTDKTPLDIDLLFNTVVPITVGKVLQWNDESLLIETAVEGVMLTSTVDLMKVWPTIWPNHSRAERTIKDGVPNLPGFERVAYQLDGPKMNKRTGYFDRNMIFDPLAWLTARLGPLTGV